MIIIDPGHTYRLRCFDISEGSKLNDKLVFVKREGPGYPGNVGFYPGTTTQEVLRALIDRTKYVDSQIPDPHNYHALYYLRSAMRELEERAAERHGRIFPRFDLDQIENIPVCEKCGHIGCEGECRE